MSPLALCVVCVSERRDVVNMSSLYYGSIPASTFIMDILQIKVASDTSSGVVMCNRCNSSLNNFYKFYKMVRDAQHKYNEMKLQLQDGVVRSGEICLTDTKPHTSSIELEDAQGMDYEPIKEEYFEETDRMSEEGMDPDNKPIASLLREELTNTSAPIKSRLRKIKTTVRKKKTNKIERKKILRSEKATKTVLAKYKVEDIFSGGEWKISEEEKDEIFQLYIDMKCTKCDAHFSNYNLLDDHCWAKHDTHPVVSCDNFPVTSRELMERHILYKHILNCRMPRIRPRIPCKVCNKLIIDCHMRQHLSSHLPHDKREFQCNQCHAGFGTKSALKSHVSLNHEATQVPCSECGKMFRNVYHVTQHMKRVHGPSDNVHLCPECGKKYKDFTMFTNHVNEHYGIVERVKCAVCEVIIKRACLSKHMRIHDIKNQKQCPHCPYKGFQIREHVKRAHEKLKPHACQFCPKKFYNDKGLKDHMSSCHTGIPEYSCEFCGATFMSSGNCHSHRKKMHPTHWAMQKLEKANKLNSDNIPVCDASTLLRNKHFLKGAEAEQVIQDLENRKKKIKTRKKE